MLLSGLGIDAVALLQALFLSIDAASDQYDGPKPFMQLAFEQQRNLVDDDFMAGG